jgi:O-antigen/teichoic acid export membrane protein
MRALRDGWPLFLSQFTSVLYTVSGPLVIRYCSGSDAAGAYSTVERLANALLGACLLTHTAAYPRLARQYQSDRAGYLSLMRFVVLVYVGCTAMIAAATLFARPIIVPYLFGTRQPDGVDALLVCALAWLMVGIAGTALTGYMSISGRQHLVLALNLRVLLIALCLGIPGSFFLGAWAWMGALVLSQAPLLWAAAKAWRAEQAGLQVA